ncbi:MAG: YhbY family RNA-binding protein [Bulleidia sp.]
MMNTKQKRYLTALAVQQKPLFQIGKEEPGDTFFDMLDRALEKRELLKIKVLKTAVGDSRELARVLAEKTNSEIVQEIGHRIVLYRRSGKNPVIRLP